MTTTPTQRGEPQPAVIPVTFSHAPDDIPTTRTTDATDASSETPAHPVHFSAPTGQPKP